MKISALPCACERLETRTLFAWSDYAQLVNQDEAAATYSNITGDGVAVAVIDTGINYSLAPLGGGFGAGYKVVAGYDFFSNDSDPMDTDGHGTAVASVIAAEPYTFNGVTYQGVAPDADLVALRVGTADDLSNTNIEKALQWVITNWQTYNIAVVNLSLGSGNYTDSHSDSQFSDEFAQLRQLGIFVVAASGNSNDQASGPISQDGIAFPAADPNVFAVSAVSSSDVISTWAQRGDELDLLAPGASIVLPNLSGGYASYDGTSFSSPYVAGTAALIKQATPAANAGDIGSILMSSGTSNRDGDNETGNTTDLLFSRLDINAALALATKRLGKYKSLALTKAFDTALDSQGVLHAAFHDTTNGDLLYATRATSGKWSVRTIIDSAGEVGSQMSIAVDATGKVGIAYFDDTNTAIKYASFDGTQWSIRTIDSDKHVGTFPSLGFSNDGDAFVAYYRRSGGYLRLARIYRDTGVLQRTLVDGADADVGANVSLDVGEAPISGPFTQYDTTVAMAYADSTNGNLKYARLDVDDTAATWFVSVVDDTDGIGSIDLDLHAGPSGAELQAQIAYQLSSTNDVKYAYRYTDWFTETVSKSGDIGYAVQLSFDADDRPTITQFNNTKRAIYTSTRDTNGSWSMRWDASASAWMSVSINERSGEVVFSYLNRDRTAVLSTEFV